MNRRLLQFVLITTIISKLLSTATASNAETCAQEETTDPSSAGKKEEWTVPNPYRFFEEAQLISKNNGNFGHFLDAGTGKTSISWLSSIIHRSGDDDDDHNGVSLESYTAITADDEMHQKVTDMTTQLGINENGQIIIGNWADGVKKDGKLNTRKNNYLLHGAEQFDTILADYLVGAIDRFSPYFQDVIFDRLTPHLKPGGRIFILGLEPIPDKGTHLIADIWSQIKRARDASMMLAGERPYREYPLEWMERNLARVDGLTVVARKIYPLFLPFDKLVKQINNGRLRMKDFSSEELKVGMAKVFDGLEAESLRITKRAKDGKIPSGFEYALVIEKKRQ